jgi:hypothetical protein
MTESFICIDLPRQMLKCYQQGELVQECFISSALNGPGEIEDSGCTPRGWHEVVELIGLECPIDAVFVARQWTKEIYSEELSKLHPTRDWILTRILRLRGLETGRNLGEGVDSYNRYIYIHGTPDIEPMGLPKSHGCIRMRNKDVIKLAACAQIGTKVFIDNHLSLLR